MLNFIRASIIITTYNRPAFLERAIISCLHQDYRESYEIIIVDDNGLNTKSQKETETRVVSFAQVVYIPLEKNSGACVARNQGAAKARGEFLFFLDDDDECLPNKLSTQIAFMKQHPELDGCLAAFRRVDAQGNDIVAESNKPIVGDFKNFVLRGNFFTPMLCIKKNSFLKSGGFIDIPRFQDRFYLMNSLKKGYQFAAIPNALHIMYEHNEDRITSVSVASSEKALSQMYEWIIEYKAEFTKTEWSTILNNRLRGLAVSYYNASTKKERIKSAFYYGKLFLHSFAIKDLISACKGLVK